MKTEVEKLKWRSSNSRWIERVGGERRNKVRKRNNKEEDKIKRREKRKSDREKEKNKRKKGKRIERKGYTKNEEWS